MGKPLALIVLDGFGWREEKKDNPIALARKPTFDYLWRNYPHTLLQASGTAVGLPPDTPGNSEVGHMTLGAGRIIEQPITEINKAIADGSFYQNPVLREHLQQLVKNNHALHIMGLLSDGNVHSAEDHVYAYIKAALDVGVPRIIIHVFLDGRDVPPKSAAHYLERLDAECKKHPQVEIGSLCGRYYAMDRDNNWDRTAQAYNCLTSMQKSSSTTWQQVLEHYYAKNITDEFIPPTQLHAHDIMKSGDGVIFFNVRADRARQIMRAFVDSDFHHFKIKKLDLSFFMTPLDLDGFKNVTVLFPPLLINHTLKEILSANKKTMFCIAETEKYAHVTYFFAGNHEQVYPYEEQRLIASLKMKNYVAHPEMSAANITKAVIISLETDPRDFYLVNYANADMVGHSGSFPATVKAIECLDVQLKILYEQIVVKRDGIMLITADHGNAELKYNDGKHQPSTSHSTSPVPFLYVAQKVDDVPLPKMTGLADVAPFILHLMGLPVPREMKGSLL